ncbi:MAG TPA: hypothetical protein ENK02_06935 [Planctomycetes bacterium]|nr:hypothetical protein [Planctomycetota bacterium]
MKPSNMDNDEFFETFRREKSMRRRQRLGTPPKGEAPANQAARTLAEDERKEALDIRLQREMMEFVESTTRVAAKILTEVEEQKARLLSEQITKEMREFFKNTLCRAEELVRSIQVMGKVVKETDIEPHLAELDTQTLDEFRVEGSAEGAKLHLGQPVPPDAEPNTIESNDLAENPPRPRLPFGQEGESKQQVDESGTCELEALGAEFDFPVEEDFDAEELQSEDRFYGGEMVYLHEEESEQTHPSDDPEPRETPTPPQEAPAASSSLPPAFEALVGDPERLKRALTLMVKNGLMSKEEARAAFQESRRRK